MSRHLLELIIDLTRLSIEDCTIFIKSSNYQDIKNITKKRLEEYRELDFDSAYRFIFSTEKNLRNNREGKIDTSLAGLTSMLPSYLVENKHSIQAAAQKEVKNQIGCSFSNGFKIHFKLEGETFMTEETKTKTKNSSLIQGLITKTSQKAITWVEDLETSYDESKFSSGEFYTAAFGEDPVLRAKLAMLVPVQKEGKKTKNKYSLSIYNGFAENPSYEIKSGLKELYLKVNNKKLELGTILEVLDRVEAKVE